MRGKALNLDTREPATDEKSVGIGEWHPAMRAFADKGKRYERVRGAVPSRSGALGAEPPSNKKGKRASTRAIFAAFLLFMLTVCLYLERLEYNSHADILFPTNYHSIMEVNNREEGTSVISDTDSLNAYYQSYSRQEGRPYTIRQDLLLSRLAHINAPQGFRGETAGATVRELCDEVERILRDEPEDIVRQLGCTRQELLDLTTGIGEHDILRDLVIKEYIESASGLAGYVLEKDDAITITLRGTDDIIDALDNALLLPFNLSVQYPAMNILLAKYNYAAHIWLTGHSKGGHNAIYAASIDPRCRAAGFNAPGFGIFLSDSQHDRLDNGVNYVINGDVTGFLLFHLERRIVIESIDSPVPEGFSLNKWHRLDNFFSIDDLTVSEKILSIAICSEWITQILWLSLVFLAGYGVIRLCARMCNICGIPIQRTTK